MNQYSILLMLHLIKSADMEYSNDVTLSHPLSKHARNLNELSRNDGGKGLFDNDAIAISLDDAEHSRGVSPNMTMDIAIGTIRKGTADNPRNEKMTMCEFRFNFKSMKNISKTDLEEKIRHSRTLLQQDEYPINETCYFLFSDNLINQARNAFNRLYHTRTKHRVVKTEAEMSELLSRG